MNDVTALVPMKGNSERVPRKNIRPLGGHPVLAYSIAAALESDLFAAVAALGGSGKVHDARACFRSEREGLVDGA